MTQTILKPSIEIPGPKAVPIIGSKGNLISFMRDPIGYMMILNKNYGDLVSLVRGVPNGMVFAFGPKHNQQILSESDTFLNAGITQPGPIESANHRIGIGLLSMNGEEHKRMRRLVSTPFHYKQVPNYHNDIVKLTEEMLSNWKSGDTIDIWHEMTELTKRISIKLLLGLDDPKTALSVANLMEEWMSINISFPARTMQVNLPGFPYNKMLRLAENLEKRLLSLIQQKRSVLSSDDHDVLSLLLTPNEDGEVMSDRELAGQVNFLFAASFETTANSMTWISFLLSQHPEIMQEIYEDLVSTLDRRNPEYSDLEKLSSLERVMKEGLRLLAPPVYAYRVLSKPATIGDYEFPANSTVAFSHYITHHMETLYDQPNRFNPDRWKDIKPTNFEYLPFGVGAHACLGGSLAYMIMKIVLSMTLRKFRLKVVPNSDISRKVLVTLAPKYGIPVKVYEQDENFAASKSKVTGDIHEMVELN